MKFGLEKCAVIHMKRGKICNSPIIDNIPLMTGEETYMYLGITHADEILHEKVKNRAKKEYFERVRGILKNKISAKNTTDSIWTFAMPILRSGFGIVKWTQNEIRKIDCKTRKILTKNNSHHPKNQTLTDYTFHEEWADEV